MGAWTELQERDRLMAEFIDQDPIHITLHRPTWTETAAGGRVQSADTELDAQVFAVYPFKRRLTLEYKFSPQTLGEEKVEEITWILIWNREDTDIQVNDWFNPSSDVTSPVGFNRLLAGKYEVTFLSARLWDRGQAGILYRG